MIVLKEMTSGFTLAIEGISLIDLKSWMALSSYLQLIQASKRTLNKISSGEIRLYSDPRE